MTAAFFLGGCAYRLGSPDRILPGGIRRVDIPVFKNRTAEPTIEVAFTNSLIEEFQRSKIVTITTPAEAEADIVGEITALSVGATASSQATTLPTNTVLNSEYQVLVKVKVSLVRKNTGEILWTGDFNGEKTYEAPQVTAAVINTVNPLYNLSAKRKSIEAVASEMMSEAHDRITENF